MAYCRHTLFENAILRCEHVQLLQAAPAWSDDYHVGSERLLFPLTASFECRLGSRSARSGWVCDPVSALWLTPTQAYSMRRRHPGQRNLMLAFNGAPWGGSRRLPLSATQQWALRQIVAAPPAAPHDALALEERLIAFASALLGEPTLREPPAHRAVERAREWLAEDPGRDAGLEDIARAVHCSPFHLARTFRRHTGHTLHGHRTRLRMTLALTRLQDGASDLAALALDLGYSSHSHFSAVFQRTFGCTPSRMRRNLAAPIAH
jgi:AraC family transcriptional regulator